MYHPTLEEVKALAREGNLIPVYRDIPADLETPVSAYLKVARTAPSFLLESVEGGERLARYSFIGTEPYKTLWTGPDQEGGAIDPLLAIQEEMGRFRPVRVPGLPRFLGGAVGYLAYEVARYFERLPTSDLDPITLPEAVFLFTDTLLVFDHLKHIIKVVSHAHLDDEVDRSYLAAVERIEGLVKRLRLPLALEVADAPVEGGASGPVTSNLTQEEFEASVRRAREYIIAGECIQVVLSQRLSKRTPARPFDIYRSLRALNPSPYMYYLDLGDFQIVGASPELLVRVEEGEVATHPIAGTRPRGQSETEDAALSRELLADEKERAEHVMLLDLGRNDIGRVSQPGTVQVTQLMEIEHYSHVMHIVSHVTGRLKPELTAYDALRACFPAGTVSGAPKIRAMGIIADLEPHQRGPYAGAVGYFSFGGNMDTAITIRTIVMRDGVAHVQAGGGIVFDSVPLNEYNESLYKAQALLRAIEEAEERAAAGAANFTPGGAG